MSDVRQIALRLLTVPAMVMVFGAVCYVLLSTVVGILLLSTAGLALVVIWVDQMYWEVDFRHWCTVRILHYSGIVLVLVGVCLFILSGLAAALVTGKEFEWLVGTCVMLAGLCLWRLSVLLARYLKEQQKAATNAAFSNVHLCILKDT